MKREQKYGIYIIRESTVKLNTFIISYIRDNSVKHLVLPQETFVESSKRRDLIQSELFDVFLHTITPNAAVLEPIFQMNH